MKRSPKSVRIFCLLCLMVSCPFSRIAAQDSLNHVEIVRLLKQPKSMDCWATALTILYSWKQQDNTVSIDDVISQYGEPFITYFRTNAGIQSDDELALYAKAGLQVIQEANPTIGEWYNLLKTYGPLSITVGYPMPGDPPHLIIHALVVDGIHGDGTSDHTTIDYEDPASGQQETPLSFSDFLNLYQLGSAYSVQIIHW